MISFVRHDANILDPNGDPNHGEMQNGVHIACATSTNGTSKNPHAITYQLVDQFGVKFTSTDALTPKIIGGVFTTDKFDFSSILRARAYAIVCHTHGDMTTQDYSQANKGLESGLRLIHTEGLVISKDQKREIRTRMRSDMLASLKLPDDELLTEMEGIMQDVKSKINPLVRMALMARGSPKDMLELLKVMGDSPTNIALYINPTVHAELKATILKFPGICQDIPALAHEELYN